MKKISKLFFESNKNDAVWCLWDYVDDHGIREILIWKGDGNDKSDITEIDKYGTSMLNIPFDQIKKYLDKYNTADIDKLHLDFKNADIDKIPSLF